MKKIAMFMVLSAMLMACNFGSSSTAIKVGENEKGALFEAKFPEEKMEEAAFYFSQRLAANIFENIDQDRVVDLGDSLKFKLESSVGEIKITFNKSENSIGRYNKLMAICKGFGKAIE